MTKEKLIISALQDELARMETMQVIEKIRELGGTQTVLKLAGYILTAEEPPKIA